MVFRQGLRESDINIDYLGAGGLNGLGRSKGGIAEPRDFSVFLSSVHENGGGASARDFEQDAFRRFFSATTEPPFRGGSSGLRNDNICDEAASAVCDVQVHLQAVGCHSIFTNCGGRTNSRRPWVY